MPTPLQESLPRAEQDQPSVPLSAENAFVHVTCVGCQCRLQMPATAQAVSCPHCSSTTKAEDPRARPTAAENAVVHVTCVGCQSRLQMPATAQAVSCPRCSSTTKAEDPRARPTAAPASTAPAAASGLSSEEAVEEAIRRSPGQGGSRGAGEQAKSTSNAKELFKEKTTGQLAKTTVNIPTDWRLKLWEKCSNMLQQGVQMGEWTDAEKLEYDPAKASWVNTPTRVKVHVPEQKEGVPASVFVLAEDDNQRLHMGNESGSIPEWRHEDLHVIAKKQAVLSMYTNLFSELVPSHAVRVPRAWIYHIPSLQPPCVVWAEEDLSSSYGEPPSTLSLFESASGSPHALAVLQFLMFQRSNGQLVVHSVEAKGQWWTDPVIFSVDGSMGSESDSGLKGIKAWKRLFANIYSPLLDIDRNRLFSLEPADLVFEMKAAGCLIADGERPQKQPQQPFAGNPGTPAVANASFAPSTDSTQTLSPSEGQKTDPSSGVWEVASKLRFQPTTMSWDSVETRVRMAAVPIAMISDVFCVRAADADSQCSVLIPGPQSKAAEDNVHLSVKRQTVLGSYLAELRALTPAGAGFWSAETWVYHLKQRTKRNDVRAVSLEASQKDAVNLALPPHSECMKQRPKLSQEQHLLAALQFLMYKRSGEEHVVQSMHVVPTVELVHGSGLEARDPVLCSVDGGFGTESDQGYRGMEEWRQSFVAIYKELLNFKSDDQLMAAKPATLIRMMSAKGLFGAPTVKRAPVKQVAAAEGVKQEEELDWIFRPLTGDVFSAFEVRSEVQGDPSANSAAPEELRNVGEGGAEEEEEGWLLHGVRNVKGMLQTWEDSIQGSRQSTTGTPTKPAPTSVNSAPPITSTAAQDPRAVGSVGGAAAVDESRDSEEMQRKSDQLAFKWEQVDRMEEQTIEEHLELQRRQQEHLERSQQSQSQPENNGYRPLSMPHSVTRARQAVGKDMPSSIGDLHYRILSHPASAPSKPVPKWLSPSDPTRLHATPDVSRVLDEEVSSFSARTVAVERAAGAPGLSRSEARMY